ncbi:MAG: tRNA pseudouridine(55) synthase TruB [Helicobacter sp.]|nr:tRNA pseudouridine(55) synthase TruB [Helicobacter sp.]
MSDLTRSDVARSDLATTLRPNGHDALFVAYKPTGITSRAFLDGLKRRFAKKKLKAGFFGTLDPFACGSLIVAFGAYTKLFGLKQKVKKRYFATLWLGVQSRTLDITDISKIEQILPVDLEDIKREFSALNGARIQYIPPIFSAKKINGKRAYQIAREGKDVDLTPSFMNIFDLKFISYRHPFLSFEITLNGGAYVRSFGDILAKRFLTTGALSFLERIEDSGFSGILGREILLDPIDFLGFEVLYLKDLYANKNGAILRGEELKVALLNGAKMHLLADLALSGIFVLNLGDCFSVVKLAPNLETLESNFIFLLNGLPC